MIPMLKLTSTLTAAGLVAASLAVSTAVYAETADTNTKHRTQQHSTRVVPPPVGFVESRSQIDQLNRRSWLDPGSGPSEQSGNVGPAYVQSQTILNTIPASGYTERLGYRALPGPFDIPTDQGPLIEFWTPALLR
jgi:hypothetical protein